MSPKIKRILNIVLDVIIAAVMVLVIILAVSAISSKAKGYEGYTEIFGKAYLSVQDTHSMEGDGEDNFSSDDVIVIRVVKDSNQVTVRDNLAVGDIITFKQYNSSTSTYILNTHRIIAINDGRTEFTTHGDNVAEGNDESVSISDIVGVYKCDALGWKATKASGIGRVMVFMNSSVGFFVCVVLPTLIIVVYCAINLILVIMKEKKTQTAAESAQREEELLSEKEKMRAEILAELAANGNAVPAVETVPEKSDEAPTEEVGGEEAASSDDKGAETSAPENKDE